LEPHHPTTHHPGAADVSKLTDAELTELELRYSGWIEAGRDVSPFTEERRKIYESYLRQRGMALVAAARELQSLRAELAAKVERWREWAKELEQRSPEGASSWMLAARDLEAILRGE
jgi:hypothetical protein